MPKKSTKEKKGNRCGSKAQVMRGTADFTRGLSKGDMVKGKNGKIVNKEKSAAASKKKSPHLKMMNEARFLAMREFPDDGAKLFVKGSAINKARSRIYKELKEGEGFMGAVGVGEEM
jgi:hypothetical protein